MADFLESHEGRFDPPDGQVMLNVWPPVGVNQKQWLADMARICGHAKKLAQDKYFFVRKSCGQVVLDFNVYRDKVCKRRQVGTRTVPAQPEREEPVYEWDCPDSLLREES